MSDFSERRWLSLDGPIDAPLMCTDHRPRFFDVERIEWLVMFAEPGSRPIVKTVLYGADSDGEQTNYSFYGSRNATGSPAWPEGAPLPPYWFHLAAVAFLHEHAPDLDPPPVSSQAGLSTIRTTPTTGGDAA